MRNHKPAVRVSAGKPAAPQLFQLGTTLSQLGERTRAIEAFQTYLRYSPDDKHAHYNLAVTLKADGDAPGALASFNRALRLDPNYPEAWNNLGNLLHEQGHLSQAQHCLEQALRSRPDYLDAEYNLAQVESDAGLHRNAIFRLTHLLGREPAHAQAWNNLGKALLLLGEPQDASEMFAKALQLRPRFPIARWNSAVAQLTLGNFEESWANFEHRSPHRYDSFRRWDGSTLEGKRILIHAEQGFGDTIQFVRYCPLVKALGGHVILECQSQLVNLFAGVEGIDTLIPRGAALPSFDCQIPLMSVPGVLRTTLNTIPRAIPYLHPNGSRNLHQKLQASDSCLRVGLVWAGSSLHPNDRSRSLSPTLLRGLVQPPNVHFYSLQQKPQSAGLQDLQNLRFADVWDELSFEDTAAIVANLDLLITVDTSVAHLAGALGRPVWTLLPFAPDWRWMLGRSDSPWYPTMRLYRQPKLNDWESVLRTVSADLEQLASTRRG
jgi:Flp pilus assembly protein TadD